MTHAHDTWTRDLAGAAAEAFRTALPVEHFDASDADLHGDDWDCTCGVLALGGGKVKPRSCDRHGWRECIRCAVVDQAEQIRLDGNETYHPACVQAFLDQGEFTAEELAPWREELEAAGVVFPEAAPVASAAE